MMRFIRYTLAAVCFAASVGCLLLWWWAIENQDQLLAARYRLKYGTIVRQFYRGGMSVAHVSAPVKYSGANRFGPQLIGSTPLVKNPVNVSLESLTEPIRIRDNDRWYIVDRVGKYPLSRFGAGAASGRQFGHGKRRLYFPLWYPALVFTLAGVGVLRFRRQFSIRSALIATTAVAALVGMAVIM